MAEGSPCEAKRAGTGLLSVPALTLMEVFKMKKSTAIIGWVLTVMFALAAFGYGGFGIPLLLAAAVLICPAFRTRVELPGKVWIPAVVLLFCAAAVLAPKQPDVKGNTQAPSAASGSSAQVESEADSDEVLSSVSESSSDGSLSDASAPVDADAEAVNEFPYHVTFYDRVNNDVTGNWRLSLIAEYELADIQDYAVAYYRSYFKDDSEVHFIVNFTLKTTTCITCDSGLLFVSVYDYVDGEEHDAKVMPSGTPLASYVVTISDGSIEDVSGG